jgi:putative membrane protein
MKRGTKYQIFLIVVFLAVWIWAAINPVFPHDWLLENYLVFIFVPLILITGIYFRLSNLSYTLIALFMILHVVGSHYTYAEVPFGYFLQDLFGANRNMYDRLVHFSFGLLLAYPVREVFMRLSRTKGFWSYWFPVELTLAFSAIYEIIEWVAASAVDPAAGLAFLGAQGDVWDAQKDMLLAGIGAVIAMFVVYFVRLRYDRNLWKEMKDSFKIPRGDKPLGEVKLGELIRKSNFVTIL